MRRLGCWLLLSVAIGGVLGCASSHATPTASDAGADLDAPSRPRDAREPAPFDGTPPRDDAGTATSTECDALSRASCERLETCTYGVGVAHDFGDSAICVARTAAWCRALETATGTTVDPMVLFGCAEAIRAAECGDFLYDAVPECRFVGTLEPGERCIIDAQCTTALCAGACGTCTMGGPMIIVGEGEACAGHLMRACDARSVCVGLRGKGSVGVCRRLALAPGEACDRALVTAPTCDAKYGLYCDPETSACAVQTIVPAGAACAPPSYAPAMVCAAGARCDEASATCVPPLADGAACGLGTYDVCAWPAACVPSVDGAMRCVLPAETRLEDCPAWGA